MSARGQEIGKGTGGVGGVVRRHGKKVYAGLSHAQGIMRDTLLDPSQHPRI